MELAILTGKFSFEILIVFTPKPTKLFILVLIQSSAYINFANYIKLNTINLLKFSNL